jgi:hypothetical protein
MLRLKEGSIPKISIHARDAASLANSAFAGLLATIPMTITMIALHWLFPQTRHKPLVPKEVTSSVVHKTDMDEMKGEKRINALTVASHFGFGLAAGAPFELLANRLPGNRIGKGMLYGLLVWFGSYMGWIPALNVLPPASRQSSQRNFVMILAHLVWGSSLALFLKRLGEPG